MKGAILVILVALGCYNSTLACTVFGAARNGRILAAKNQDYHITDTRMLIRPPHDGKYGVIHFGDKNEYGFCNTSGVNDQGLWYAGASVPERGDIRNVKNKPRYDGELIEGILEQCATVDEAIDMYNTYFTPHWSGHSLLMDATGNSVIVEYGQDDVVFLTSPKDFQVITNYYESDSANARWNTCYRHDVAEAMLFSNLPLSINLFRDICEATHAEGAGATVLSTIHDLRSGDIYIYDFHNFQETVKVNVHELLKNGEQYYAIRPFFHQLALTSPENAAAVETQGVTLSWVGNGDRYHVYCSPDSTFELTEPIYVEETQVQHASFGGFFHVACVAIILCFVLKKNQIF